MYVPPHKLRILQEEMMQKEKSGEDHQKMMWDLLRKSINGIVNKVSLLESFNHLLRSLSDALLSVPRSTCLTCRMLSSNFSTKTS